MITAEQHRERGSALVEFLFTALIWLPLLLGTMVFGINIVRAIQVSQLSRDTGHMYAYGVDFTQPQNVAILTRLARSVDIEQNAGTGAVLLSKITLVTQQDCDAAMVKVCTNLGQYVFTDSFVFGNSAYAQTKLGGDLGNNHGSIPAVQYLTNKNLVATNFSSLLTFPAGQSGQYAYVSEVTLNSQAITWNEFSNTGSYARSIF